MILLPSRGRPHKLKRFFEAHTAMHGCRPGVVMIEPQDRDGYGKLTLPDGWRIVEVEPGMVSRKFNDGALKIAPGESSYQLMADDCVPETDRWDELLAESAGEYAIAYGNDCMDPPPPCGHPCIGGHLINALGWIAAPNFGHFWWDNVLADIGNALGPEFFHYLPHVITRHLHWTLTGDYDNTCRARGCPEYDEMTYSRWCVHSKHADVERVKEAYGFYHRA